MMSTDQIQAGTYVKGIWIRQDPKHAPDVVIYYVNGMHIMVVNSVPRSSKLMNYIKTHQGGGFALGSCHFYLEFLLAWHHLLVNAGYKNPAIFALEYTLVPEATYPTQVSETMLGWKHALQMVNGDGSRICVAGDSAGGTLILSLLLQLGAQGGSSGSTAQSLQDGPMSSNAGIVMPQLAVLISPWVTLTTKLHHPSKTDYLNRDTLWQYAHAYAGSAMINQPPASPGACVDEKSWLAASPRGGYVVFVGQEEVLAPDIENFVEHQTRMKVRIKTLRMEKGVHAWPIAAMYLATSVDLRLHWLKVMTNEISLLIPVEASEKEERTAAFSD
ncbi:hypothetical protein CDD82_6260 [Ophiocordyceps australis]|uniref:Alpha/beta hydrolase fold-3 domain-containing protein n=1 Tax=Ophiocordyceps australis TaxID=1399860 RepID=A0A2C5YW76_9HYPO|nr:hypothetical protein CDD82_6260 [Ophiocordyceps australis]